MEIDARFSSCRRPGHRRELHTERVEKSSDRRQRRNRVAEHRLFDGAERALVLCAEGRSRSTAAAVTAPSAAVASTIPMLAASTPPKRRPVVMEATAAAEPVWPVSMPPYPV